MILFLISWGKALTERENGYKIADDNETVEAVTIPDDAVPEFKSKTELRNWLIGKFAEVGNVTINSTGANVDFNRTAAQRAVKNARNRTNNISYPEIKNVVANAKYSGFRRTDERHQNVKGQDVYHSGVMYKGNPYSVTFYVDVPLEGNTGDNFAGNKISKIEIASADTQVTSENQNRLAQSHDAIPNISLAVLRGKVKPARYDASTSTYYQVAEENARLDAENPIYNGETININGQEKTVYNSNGDRIAQSAEALRNFYKWFGDSKAVDEKGRPLVVYHGTNAEFDTFDKNKAFDGAFYFSSNKEFAKGYGNIMPTYLSIKNPTTTIPASRIQKEEFSKQGYDGVAYKDASGLEIFAAFEPNQIKSVENRGSFSPESDNIYYQRGEVPIPSYEFYDNIKASPQYQDNIKYSEEVFDMVKSAPHVEYASIDQSINRLGGQSTYIDGYFDNGVSFLIRISDHESNYDLSNVSVGYGADKNKILELLEYRRGAPDRAKEASRQRHIAFTELLKKLIPESYYQYADSKETFKELAKKGVIERPVTWGFNPKEQEKYGKLGVSWKDIENFVKKKGDWAEEQGEVYYQGEVVENGDNRLTTREDGPSIAADNEMVEVVSIPEGSVPDFKTKKELVNFIKEILGNEREIIIKSTNDKILISNAGINRSAAKIRTHENKEVFAAVKNLLENAKYSGFEMADKRHLNVKGQDVYHAALEIGEKLYSVQFKIDIPLENGSHNYAGHKVSEIEIALSENADGRFTSPMQTDNAIHTVSLSVLRGKVKPARYDASTSTYYQRGFAASRVDYDRPSLEAIGTGEWAHVQKKASHATPATNPWDTGAKAEQSACQSRNVIFLFWYDKMINLSCL